MNWIKRNYWWLILVFLVSLLPGWIVAGIIHYNLEPRHKIYVEWTVYDGPSERTFHGTYDIVGDRYGILNTWHSTGKHGGSYRAVSIIDKDNWGAYISKQSVCIYTGLNDVKVNKIEIVE